MLEYSSMHANSIIQSYSKIFRREIPMGEDPTFLFTAYQALYRMFDYNNNAFSVLHASAAVTPRGNTIIFGDNGNDSKGKTFCSLILAINSEKYIADEYILFEKNTSLIYGNGDIPINLKTGTYNYLISKYGIELHNEKVAFANDYFKIVEKIKPSLIVIPYLGSEQTRVITPTKEESVLFYKATVFGHNIKFNHPETDLVSLIKAPTKKEPEKVTKFLEEYPDIISDIPLIEVHLKEPHDILAVLNDIEQG